MTEAVDRSSGERDASVETLAAQLSDTARSENSAVIVAELDGDLAGYVEVSGGAFRRTRSTACTAWN